VLLNSQGEKGCVNFGMGLSRMSWLLQSMRWMLLKGHQKESTVLRPILQLEVPHMIPQWSKQSLFLYKWGIVDENYTTWGGAEIPTGVENQKTPSKCTSKLPRSIAQKKAVIHRDTWHTDFPPKNVNKSSDFYTP
jgi:hypothetical protein